MGKLQMYAWRENLASGAYHEDGSALVLAESKAEARALLVAHDEASECQALVKCDPPRHAGEYTSYKWGKAASEVEPTVIGPALGGYPAVVMVTVGCDC